MEGAAAREKEISCPPLQVKALEALLDRHHPAMSESGVAGAADLVELRTGVESAAPVYLTEPVIVERAIYNDNLEEELWGKSSRRMSSFKNLFMWKNLWRKSKETL